MNKERADRAKIFAPFDPLKGFREALAEKERQIVPKKELSEEALEELNQKLGQLQKNMIVTLIYFSNGEYVKITGMVSKFDRNNCKLRIVNTDISFEDICSIQVSI